jgi:hypothetical protein
VIEPPPPPDRPEPYECCGRGCEPCIFDYYNNALERWRETMLSLGLTPEPIARATPGQPR